MLKYNSQKESKIIGVSVLVRVIWMRWSHNWALEPEIVEGLQLLVMIDILEFDSGSERQDMGVRQVEDTKLKGLRSRAAGRMIYEDTGVAKNMARVNERG